MDRRKNNRGPVTGLFSKSYTFGTFLLTQTVYLPLESNGALFKFMVYNKDKLGIIINIIIGSLRYIT